MIKFLFVARRAPGTTRTAAQAHLRDVHGRMVVLPPSDAGAMPAYYAQNHVLDGAYPGGNGVHAVERDLVTELQFESLEAMRAAVGTPYYREHLRPDEPRFVDDASVVRLPVVPRVIVAGERTRFKLLVFVSRGPGTPDAAWQATCAVIATSIARVAGLSALTENIADTPADGVPFADVVFEAWFDDRTAAEAVIHTPQLLSLDAHECVRPILILAEEFTEDRLRALLA